METNAAVVAPRIVIRYCTQCKWMLRAAYFGQELLSTFGVVLGEVALQPTTGGVFTIDIVHSANAGGEVNSSENEAFSKEASQLQVTRLWDRKTEGFPEVKELKRRVRDIVEPDRDLGHVEKKTQKVEESRNHVAEDSQIKGDGETRSHDERGNPDGNACEDCS